MNKIYRCAGLGGSFDHLHQGHKQFLEFAARQAQLLVIGVTGQKMTLHKPHADSIQNLTQRVVALKNYVATLDSSFEVIVLDNIYGSTLEDERLKALIATPETISGCELINDARIKLKLQALPIKVCPMYFDDSGLELHADRIRAGLVNREGRVYEKIFEKTVKLNDKQRQFFSKIQGRIVEQSKQQTASPTILVGDATMAKFIANRWTYNVAIFDRQTQRQPSKIDNIRIDAIVKNPAGCITPELSREVLNSLSSFAQSSQQKFYLHVEGEEDLATVAAVLHAPLGSLVYYGQPNQGLVEIEVNEAIKEKFAKAIIR